MFSNKKRISRRRDRTKNKIFVRSSKSLKVAGWRPPPPYIDHHDLICSSVFNKLFADWDSNHEITYENQNDRLKQYNHIAHKLAVMYNPGNKRAKNKTEYDLWFSRYDYLRNELIKVNMPIVYSIMAKHKFHFERDDMISHGMFALMKAIDAFNPWGKIDFYIYASSVIYKRYCRELKKIKRRVKEVEYKEFYDQCEYIDFGKDFDDSERMNDISYIINKNLISMNEKQKEIINLFMQNFSGGQIARELNVSPQSVNQMINVIADKINNFYFTGIP